MNNIAKNLLCENTCSKCDHIREIIQVEIIKYFPHIIPYAYTVIEMEKCNHHIRYSIMTYIKDGKVYIAAEDYNIKSKYFLHMICEFCEVMNSPIPEESSCEYFIPLK